jgi:hypothetical protein
MVFFVAQVQKLDVSVKFLETLAQVSNKVKTIYKIAFVNLDLLTHMEVCVQRYSGLFGSKKEK